VTGNEGSGETVERQDTTSPNRVHQELLRASLDVDVELAGLRARLEGLDAARQRVDAQAIMLADRAAAINELEVARSLANNSYRGLYADYEGAMLNEARGAEEIAQVDRATAPLYPDRPLRHLYALFGLLCGLAGGLLLAFGAQQFRGFWSLAREEPAGRQLAPGAALQAGYETTAIEGRGT
jgi:uncharacterized protein involved in exopolysaccharide biosynthesis